jgi:hypothetical protein
MYITAVMPEDSSRTAADDRRARMQDRLTQARQKPAAPQRGGPGWE